jgi:hypothetical protein
MKKWLFNPFEMVAGWTSVIIGLAIIIITSLVAYFTRVHLDGVIDLHAGTETTITFSFIEGFVDWLSMAVLIYFSGLIISSSSIRFIDVIGTNAMARAPYLLACLFSVLIPNEKIMKYFEWEFFHKGEQVVLLTSDIVLFTLGSLVMILCSIWMIILMYRAYSVCCNVKGTKGIVSFIVTLIISEILSKILLSFFYNQLN